MKKHLALLLPIFALVLSGCGGSSGETSSGSEPSSGSSGQTTGSSGIAPTSITPTSSQPSSADSHITGISISPSKAFVTQQGKMHKFTVSYTGSPTNLAEKAVTWSVTPSATASINLVEVQDKSHCNAEITFNATGTYTVRVQSDFESAYVRETKVTVYPDNDYIYLWNCSSGDSDKFSAATGNANLNNKIWSYDRHNPSTAYGKDGQPGDGVQGSQDVDFGTSALPEGAIDLTLSNTKKIEKIVVSTSSAARDTGEVDGDGHAISEDHGSSQLSITVGTETYLAATYTAKGTTCSVMQTSSRSTYVAGNITLSWSASVGYLYIQYIIVYYAHNLEEIVIPSGSAHKSLFEQNEPFSSDGLIVYAHYANDVQDYNVASQCTITPPDLTITGTKDVSVSFTDGGITKAITYQITVNPPRTIVKVEFYGEPTNKTYTAGDEINYSPMVVRVTFDAPDIHGSTTTDLNIPTSSGGDFTEVNVPNNASKALESGFTISLKYKNNLASKTFAASTYTVSLKNITIDFLNDEQVATWTGNNFIARTWNDAEKMLTLTGNFKLAEATQNLPQTKLSTNIYINIDNVNYSVKHTNFEFVRSGDSSGSEKNRKAVLNTSILGGSPYTADVVTSSDFDGDGFSSFDFDVTKGTNSIMISYNGTSDSGRIGVKKFIIGLDYVKQATIASVSVVEPISPTKSLNSYKEGESFDPTGIVINATFTDSIAYSPVDIVNGVTWSPEILIAGTTSVTGTYKGFNIVIDGLTVAANNKTYNRITSAQDNYAGTYLITCGNYVMNGKLDNSVSPKISEDNNCINAASKFSDTNTIVGNYEVNYSTIEIKKSSTTYKLLAASGIYLGCGKSGPGYGTSGSGDNYTKFSIAFVTDHIEITRTVDDKVFKFVFDTSTNKFSFANVNDIEKEGSTYQYIQLFKLAA